MPKTKKTPTSQSLAADATKGPNGTPKSSVPSVALCGLEVPARLVTRFEVQKRRGEGWGTLWGEGPIRFDSLEAATAELERVRTDWSRCPELRVLRVDDVLEITAEDLDEFAVPLVARFWRLHAPGKPRDGALQPRLDLERADVRSNWARLSGWEGCGIDFASEVELPRLWDRFPFARPATVADVVRLLTLHELAHFALGHSGVGTVLDHDGTREELGRKFAEMEDEADAVTVVFWRQGLTRSTVPTIEAARIGLEEPHSGHLGTVVLVPVAASRAALQAAPA